MGSPRARFPCGFQQPIVPAEYAFVVHTVNPFSNDAAELYAEVVIGHGETLVGAAAKLPRPSARPADSWTELPMPITASPMLI